MMKTTKLSLCVSMVGLLATLPAAYANEIVTNCTQVSAVDGSGSDSNASNNESCAKLTIPFDYGDAPASFNTLDATGGARHQLGTDVYLGKCVDGDTGLLEGMANADDADKGSPEYGTCTDAFNGDEDGVAIAPLHVGDAKDVVQVTANAACKLNAWVDWNHDGSWGGAGEQVFIDQVLSAGRNDLTMDVPAFAAEGTIYTRFRCSTTGGDGIGGEAADGEVEDYALTILPAVPKVPVSVGDTIWEDTDKDGKQTPGESVLVGATVSLLDKDGNPAKDLDGKPAATVTTDATGKYLFSNLPEGEYSVKVVPPEGYIPTLNAGTVNDVPANDDNNCSAGGDGSIKTSLFALTAGGEPVDDGDTDANSNLSVDCGFYKPAEPTHSLGNKVWVDDGAGTVANANNGKLDEGESVVADGVSLELRDASGKVLGSTTTDKGYYLFSGFAAGEYQVCVAASNFADGAKLAGFTASTGGNELDANSDVDGNDNGSDVVADGLCSSLVTLGADEPAGETDTASGKPGDDGAGTDDALSNLTVDFGVIPPKAVPKTVSVGNYIWVDANNNGTQDAGEAALAGAVVTLLDKDGKSANDIDGNPVAALTTDETGKYLFSNLAEGDYSISVTPPAGYVASKTGTDADVDTNPADTDNNCTAGNTTLPFTLTAGGEPDTAADGDDTNGNMTVDCGFYKPTHSIGNRVWVDDGAGNEANANNGLLDAGEKPVPDGVVVELHDQGGISLSTTTSNGTYLFSSLNAGEYQVCLAASNFNEGGKLAGYSPSTGGDETDANADVDNNDDGDNTPADGLCTNMIVLDDKEPTGEGLDGLGTEDNRSNLTVDFGVVPPAPVEPGTPVAVGNRIWKDTNGNGIQDEGEKGLAGATVTLTDVSGRPVTDMAGAAVAAQTTAADGLYKFTDLPEGDYIVTVAPPEGMFLTVGGIDADDDASDKDSNCRVNPVNNTVETHPFTLTAGMEPSDDGDDANANMTVDCGFYGAVSLGNRVWLDSNANGKQDSGEAGIANVTMTLFEEDGVTPATDINGNPVAAVKTDANGNYLFDNLKPGNYIVIAKPAEEGYSVTQGGADPDEDSSDTDSNCKSANGGFQTPAVTLTPGGEPGVKVDGDDESSNSTVDCGLFRPVSLGQRVWIDLNGDGKQDGGEPGVPGATVTLLTTDGQVAKDVFGNVVAPQTTDTDGNYLFGSLREGSYLVKVTPPPGYAPTVPSTDPNNNNSTDSNGLPQADGSVISNPIDLKWGEEPQDGGASNQTVGFGFVPKLQIPTLSQWGLAIMSLLLAAAAFLRRRKED
jgi:hypothetical protein